MQLTLLSPRKSLNKAYLRVKPSRSQIELFKANLIRLLDGLDESETEEHVKNDLSDFLRNTFYQKFYINTKERNDLVIHNGPDAKCLAGVLIETKKPSNKAEMIRPDHLNAKAFHELILYYLRERITNHNLEIRYLVATNIYEWFVFDAGLFEKTFAQDKSLVKQFTDFEEGRLAGKTTDFFYREIAEPFLAGLTSEIYFTMFDFREYDKPLRNADRKDDSKLIALYKLLSPEHLLKLPFSNDSNSLDKAFYTELLHIIGLTETKEGSKKLIGRKKEGDRNPGSLIESAIVQLDSLDKISRLEKPSQFGETIQERLFNVALELSITWINRILFLKLLEAQLIRYHKGDPVFAFLNSEKVRNFDDLNSLFFSVLARKPGERTEEMRNSFANVPYLNSSLFEPTTIEHACLFISQLKDGKLPLIASTVLKTNTGKKSTGELATLEYLFKFLDAYDFAGEGSEEIQEDNKTLINASVLGLIFEKINGYKDGSFFTPGFITMYMCRETIRRAVYQKFNDLKGWDCRDMEGLYDKIEDKKEANGIINQLKICDLAVGSGHFLVSALNEIIAIKSELKILSDKAGRRLKEYHVEVVNDELIITDEDGDLFEYNPASSGSQRVQEAIFHEKQTIIENCLFGVDINPNSVKICRLRLWIELLKNAYYLTPRPPLPGGEGEQDTPQPPLPGGEGERELETLPNIDINIKCGNSLISRYALDADFKQALKNSKWSIDSYRAAIMSYRNASGKEEKRSMERLIESIKTDFETEVAANDKRVVQLRKLNSDLFNLTRQTSLFDLPKKEKDEWNKKVKDLSSKILKLETELEGIKSNRIFENAFEWRFEFPEVLNDEGDFVGFDVVIGNPPYGVQLSESEDKIFRETFQVSNYQIDTYTLFTEQGNNLLKSHGFLNFIIPATWFASVYDIKFRTYLVNQGIFRGITLCPKDTFEGAVVETCLIHIQKNAQHNDIILIYGLLGDILNSISINFVRSQPNYQIPVYSSNNEHVFLARLTSSFPKINDFFDVVWGIKVYEKGKGNPPQIGNESIIKSFHSNVRSLDTQKPLIGGSEILPYKLAWRQGFINYGAWIAAPRTPEWFFPVPRIVVREVTAKGKIFAAYIEDEFVFSNSVDGIRSKSNDKEALFQLLGILNSKLASYFHLKRSGNSQKATFPKVLVQDLRDFPFNPNINLILVEKVKEILEIAVNEINITIQPKLSEIDYLVYELYGLTEEEIKIVEGTT